MYLQLDLAYVDDLKIHDLADPAIVYSLRSAKRALVPRRQQQPRSQRHGIIDRSRFYGEQVIDLAGYVNAGTDAATQDAYDELAARLALPGTKTFRFRRLGRTALDRITFTIGGGPEAPAEGFSRTVRWTATLVGADPRVYGDSLNSATYDPTASLSGGGMAMPLVFPLVFTTTTATLLQITNAGKYATPPILTVHGPVTNPIIDLLETGEQIALNTVLGSSDTVVVDVAARTVTLNGVARPDLIIAGDTDWFELVKGTNRLRLRGTGMAAAVTALTVSYREARI